MLRRWRAAWPRRGRFLQVPPAPPVAQPSVWRPETVVQAGSRPRWLPRLRRGQFHEPPWVGAAAPAPPAFIPRILQGHRPPPSGARRRRFAWVPPAQGPPPPPFLCARRRPTAKPRRGRYAQPPWLFIPPQPSVWRPVPVAARRRPPAILARHAAFIEPPWPQAAPAIIDMRRWEGTGSSSNSHDAAGSQLAMIETTGGSQNIHERDDTTAAGREDAGGVSSVWEGG